MLRGQESLLFSSICSFFFSSFFRFVCLFPPFPPPLSLSLTHSRAAPFSVGQQRLPSTAFCLLYKFFLMKLTVKQLKGAAFSLFGWLFVCLICSLWLIHLCYAIASVCCRCRARLCVSKRNNAVPTCLTLLPQECWPTRTVRIFAAWGSFICVLFVIQSKYGSGSNRILTTPKSFVPPPISLRKCESLSVSIHRLFADMTASR